MGSGNQDRVALETEDVPRLGQSESVAMETLSKFSIDIISLLIQVCHPEVCYSGFVYQL